MTDVDIVLRAQNLNVFYGDFLAVKDVTLGMRRHAVTALIGPSGCGKSTFLRCLNRMNDLIMGASVHGQIMFEDLDIYSENVDATEIRSRIGMVFQKPNPFPKSIYQNIAFGLIITYDLCISETVYHRNEHSTERLRTYFRTVPRT